MGCVLVERVSLHRGAGGSGGVVERWEARLEGLLEEGCLVVGGRMCVAMSSGRLGVV